MGNGVLGNVLGNIVDVTGRVLGLPEMNISENIAGGNTISTATRSATTNPTTQQVKAKSNTTAIPTNPWMGGGSPSTLNIIPTNNGGGGNNTNTNTITTTNSGASLDQQWRDAGNTGDRPVGWNGPGGGNGAVDLSNQIADAYAPAIQALQSWMDSANLGATEDTTSLENRVKSQASDIAVQQGASEGANKTEQQKFNDSLIAALQDSIRSFNALSQQGNARFGRGNSAGQAVGELAQQEFLRNQGGIQKEQSSGDLQFEGERTKIKQFYDTEHEKLNNFKNEAVTKIQQGLRATLDEIGNRRGEIETNKTNARLTALQNAKDNAQRVSEGYTQYKRDLVSTALTNMQAAAGRAFTPQEISANLSYLEQSIFGSTTIQNPTAQTQTFQDTSKTKDWIKYPGDGLTY